MDDTECRITVFYGIHDNTDCKQIINLIQRFILILHFLINTEKVLCPPIDLRRNSGFVDMFFYLFHKALDIIIPDTFSLGDLMNQIIVCFRL